MTTYRSTSIRKVEDQISSDLKKLTDPDSQYDYLFMLGVSSSCEEDIRNDRYKIENCQAAIWIKICQTAGAVRFCSDSESLLIKGVLEIFRRMYFNRTTDEIAACPPRFIQLLSDEVIYPEIKRNGLQKCYEKLLK